MIQLTDFIKTLNVSKTKIKFNMNAGDKNKRAWDLLLEDDQEWLNMNRWKTKQPNNNLNHAEYLITLAQYYPYGQLKQYLKERITGRTCSILRIME